MAINVITEVPVEVTISENETRFEVSRQNCIACKCDSIAPTQGDDPSVELGTPEVGLVDISDHEEEVEASITKKSFNIIVGMGNSKVIGTLDTGATCNLMPYSLFKGCGYTGLHEMKSRILMADGSTRRPVRLATIVTVKLDGELVTTNFVVLKDLREDKKKGPDTILLGWPFLVASKLDISAFKRRATYEVNGKVWEVEALDHFPSDFI